MSSADWTRLEPHRPLDKNSMGRYVPRPEGGAARLVQLVRAGARSIAVVGPTGSGKSTELFIAFRDLSADSQMFLAIFPLDHVEALGKTPEQVQVVKQSMWAILALVLAKHAEKRSLQLSAELVRKLVKVNKDLDIDVSGRDDDLLEKLRRLGSKLGSLASLRGEDLLLETLRDVRRASGQGEIVLFCDGLEKYPAEEARQILDGLQRFRNEAALVVVVPAALVVGPASYDVLANFKIFAVRAIPVADERGVPGRAGREFLKTVVFKRLEMEPPGPPGFDEVLDRAAEASGGVPRAFLQLVLDAAMYARLAERDWPTLEDLRDAMGDHAESLRRLLIKGDVDALRAADGTDGLEVDPERRLRFLTHGLLLEYKLDDRIVVHPAPLLGGLLARGSAA